jgi:hypothetical protein
MKTRAMVFVAVVCLMAIDRATIADELPATMFVVDVAKFGDSVIDGALTKLSQRTEIAVVQVGKIKELAGKTAKRDCQARDKAAADVKKLETSLEAAKANAIDIAALSDQLAAKRQELASILFADREQIVADIRGILYPDQVDSFETAYESMLDTAEAALRKMARSRMQVIFGRIEIGSTDQKNITVALVNYYRQIEPAQAALEAQYKDKLSDKPAAEEYRVKREAFMRPVREKTLEITKSLLKEDQQKEVDSEWKRRQERRIGMTLKDLGRELYPQTPEQKKGVEAATAAFRESAKDLDLASSDYSVLVEKLRKDMSVALNGK